MAGVAPRTETITLGTGSGTANAFNANQFDPDINSGFLFLLRGGSFNTSNVTLGGLVPGNTYLIQIVSHDGRGSRANAASAFGDGVATGPVSSLLNLDNTNTGDDFAGNTGDFIIGTFTADAETFVFDVFGDANITDNNGVPNPTTGNSPSSINAIQLRDISALVVDSDGDGMDDIYEAANGLDPNDDGSMNPINGANGDFDGDGISNINEFNAVPQLPAGNADADNDGLNDGEEVDGLVNTFGDPVADQLTAGTSLGAATNPFSADSDSDGLTDLDEVNGTTNQEQNPSFAILVTDPNIADTDGDELLDQYEILNQLDPNDNGDTDVNNGGVGDPDGDTVDNFNEQAAGTDPQDADTDDDGRPDGGLLDAAGNPTGELILAMDGAFINIVTDDDRATDPLNPDTDFDRLLDGAEFDAGTDPNLFDTDADGVPDAYELLENTDPLVATETPAYADIAWSVVAVDDVDAEGNLVAGVGAAAVRNDGTLLYAINMSGADATVNRVDFIAGTNDLTPRGTDDFFTLFRNNSNQGAFYQGPDPELPALLDSVWFSTGGQAIPHVLLTGLEVGTDYFVQFGVSDNRGSRAGRFATIDGDFGGEVATDPVGSTNTIYGGDMNSGLVFTGTFTASLGTQQFDVRSFLAGGATNEIFLNFLQLRIDDGTTLPPLGTDDLVIADCGFDENGDFVIELATPAAGAIVSASPDLVADFTEIDGASVTIDGNTITIAAAALDATRSFLRVSQPSS